MSEASEARLLRVSRKQRDAIESGTLCNGSKEGCAFCDIVRSWDAGGVVDPRLAEIERIVDIAIKGRPEERERRLWLIWDIARAAAGGEAAPASGTSLSRRAQEDLVLRALRAQVGAGPDAYRERVASERWEDEGPFMRGALLFLANRVLSTLPAGGVGSSVGLREMIETYFLEHDVPCDHESLTQLLDTAWDVLREEDNVQVEREAAERNDG